jgi:hypothetical protein
MGYDVQLHVDLRERENKMEVWTDMDHVSDEALSLMALNDLPEAERVLVRAHLDGCPSCRRHLRETKEFIRNFRLVARRTAMTNAWAGI